MWTIELACPECGERNSLEESELANNQLVKCAHCATALVLSQYREHPDDPASWHLESTMTFSDEGRSA